MDTIATTQLASGIRVVSEVVPGSRSVCVGTWVGVGSRDEPAELSGVSHFLEHLLFKGTRTRLAREINEAVDRVGGEMNAFTTKEYTAYYSRLPAGRLAMAVGLLGEVLTEPALRDDDVASEREVILEELAMDDDSPEDLAHTVLFEDLFAGHPLGRETAGQRQTVTTTTADEVRAFFERWYTPANFVVAAAGAIEHDELVRLVVDSFGASRAGPSPTRQPPAVTKPVVTVRRRATEQVHLALGWRGVARDDPDREALEVANHVLGGGLSSRLFEEIRERRGLAYSVYSALANYGDAGALSVYVATTPDKLDEVVSLTREQIAEIAAKGVSGDELDVAAGYLAGSYVLGLEDPSSRMARLGSQVTCYGAVRPVEEQLDRYRAVSLDDVGRSIGRVLACRPTAAAVGPIARKTITDRLR